VTKSLLSHQLTASQDLFALEVLRDSHFVQAVPIIIKQTKIVRYVQLLTIAEQTWLQINAQLATYVQKMTTQSSQIHQARSAKQVTTAQEETIGRSTVHSKLRVLLLLLDK